MQNKVLLVLKLFKNVILGHSIVYLAASICHALFFSIILSWAWVRKDNQKQVSQKVRGGGLAVDLLVTTTV